MRQSNLLITTQFVMNKLLSLLKKIQHFSLCQSKIDVETKSVIVWKIIDISDFEASDHQGWVPN